MKTTDLEALTTDQLWALHESISRILTIRITEEKRALDMRLTLLQRGKLALGEDELRSGGQEKTRRTYPRVHPKYRNPATAETWSGRGKQPRWLVAALKSGRKIEDFKIGEMGAAKTRRIKG